MHPRLRTLLLGRELWNRRGTVIQARVGEPIAGSTVLYDRWLATKIRTKILASDKVPTSQISIIVEDSEVFLMGLVTNQEATAAVEIARHVDGVARVIRAFEIYQ